MRRTIQSNKALYRDLAMESLAVIAWWDKEGMMQWNRPILQQKPDGGKRIWGLKQIKKKEDIKSWTFHTDRKKRSTVGVVSIKEEADTQSHQLVCCWAPL